MGMGSNTTPPWVDEEIIDSEKKNKREHETFMKINNLQKKMKCLKSK
jgi:hypothetical protein